MKIITLDFYPKKRPKYQSIERDNFLRENRDVCTAILADALKINERLLIGYMQKLGLRKFASHGKRIER